MYAAYARLVRPLAILIGSRPWLPRINRQLVAVDKFLQRLTRGNVGLVALAGLPGLMLTVKGAKSGLLRSTPLLCVPHEGGWLVAGSNWGHPKPPAWVGNLAAASEASVNFRGTEYAVTPHEAVGAERERLWVVMNRTWPNYAKYATRTDRTIRVFVLERS
ncbi:nitroreductase family deazaflavin-dependent oxidoreductase [Nocardioides daejeonensis]|uniref:nitroreductase family deazaflavin-dependent oxidoreductase n=1 Tax=Nocardioides daejeonensis TaxID=1046556 RepID=UPI001EF4F61E|nr:nitroreductase family deazaflavin-dependent oxidoreductase [Nocardioides daejeonensis]